LASNLEDEISKFSENLGEISGLDLEISAQNSREISGQNLEISAENLDEIFAANSVQISHQNCDEISAIKSANLEIYEQNLRQILARNRANPREFAGVDLSLKMDIKTLRNLITTHTAQLAKRQRTFNASQFAPHVKLPLSQLREKIREFLLATQKRQI